MVTQLRNSATPVTIDSIQPMALARRSALSLAVSAALAGSFAAPATAFAQDDNNQPIEEVITTGYRSSIRNAMLMKQGSDSIVEAITAEDIGKLPDTSIAESLARLPGLTAQRLNGRSQQISIRGLGPDFTTALLNGREQVTTGDNRGVEFDQYPSELLSSVVIYKTPDASLIGAGLAGTADLRTVRPLQQSGRTIAANVRYEWTDIDALNAGSEDDGVRYSVTYIDQFADDTVGIAFGFSDMSNPGQEERFNSWGYPEANPGEAVIGGAKPYVRSSDLDRTGMIGVLEFAPTDSFRTSLDLYYSEFEETQVLRGIELPLFWGGLPLEPGYTVDDGIVTAGQFSGVKGVMRNDITARDSELFAAGWNVEFDIGDTWTLVTDLSTSRVDRKDTILETYSGTGPAGSGATDDVGFQSNGDTGYVFSSTLDYTNPNTIFLTGPQGWGSDIVPGGQLGYDNRPEIEDELNQISLAVERDFDGWLSGMEIGVNFARREKSKVNDEYFLALANGDNQAPLTDTVGVTDLSFLGIDGMISYDPLKEIKNGTYIRTQNPNADVVIKSWEVDEDVDLAYVQFNLDSEIGNVALTGNFGLQFMQVDQKSSAFRASGTGSNVDTAAQTGGTDWSEVLPSANLVFSFQNDNYLRFAVARTVARARMDDIRASWTWNYDPNRVDGTTPDDGPWSGSGGNPEVEPWLANAVDLSWEKYFQDGAGYVSLAVFYKDIDQFIINLPQVEDFTGFPFDDTAGQPGTFQGYVTRPENGDGGDISGVEVSVSINGDLFSDAIRNFGIVANYSYTDSSIEPLPGIEIPIPGLSRDVANVTVYYENDSFSARVSNRYRSDFLGEVSGFGGGREFRTIEGESILDAQLSYNFSGSLEGLTLLAQGFNLTDEPLRTFDPGSTGTNRIIDYQRYGRSYMVGASYRFE